MAHHDVLKVPILGKESIHCGYHLVQYIVGTVTSTLPSSSYVLVTDTNVAPLYLKHFEAEFTAAFTKCEGNVPRLLSYAVPPGETSKSREGKAAIEDYLLLKKCTRDTVILALGGGVIGDLVGFVAATFMRGVRFVQIPTTLLAMVDSSVGGKTAIDTPHGKNLIGAFWQPEYIFIDPAFLSTLPVREFSNGMAEVVKTAAIWNDVEFADLESRSTEMFSAIQSVALPPSTTASSAPVTPAQKLLLTMIVGSISVKAHIVTVDERETGLRNLVNFGHTIGHAIEAVLTPDALHGECVSVGMILEAEVSRQLGILSQVAVGRLTRCLRAYSLPVSLADPKIARSPAAGLLTVDKLLDIMKVDKKNSGPEKKIVLLSRIGATLEQKATVVQDDVIAKVLAQAVRVIAGVPAHNPVKMPTPGSKSISNRALVLASLGKGSCRLKNLLHSDDTQVMMTALLDLKGAKFDWEDAGETVVVEGGGGLLSPPPANKSIFLGNAGTAARFMATMCTLVQRPPPNSSPSVESAIITGNARMKQRPIGPLVDALRLNGNQIEYLESPGCLPLSISPGGLKGGRMQLAASVSSQYVSSILLSAPYATEPVTLELTGGHVISQPYIDMTIAMMKSFGVSVTRRSDPATGQLLDIYDIPKGTYTNPPEYRIESDASSATYPLAIAAITGTTCTIENIGHASLQGDARFAKQVLEKMGCEVVQTATETTVTGPPVGSLKAAGQLDMETMTDAFLTASVLAAVALGGEHSGITSIVGIANQRVKECNRIKAMVDELAKFGVTAKELDDGLEIYGGPISELNQDVSVRCYDDHRVAMAFSVLGAVIKGTLLEEKRCVEKTWPNWWDDLERKIGLEVEGVDLAKQRMTQSSRPKPRDPAASVILIGMRGSGKTYIGTQAALSLGWGCIDADQYFQKNRSIDVRQYVQQYGWSAFRAEETKLLAELLTMYPTKHIISLGGGIVETPEARKILQGYAEHSPVVHVVRPIEEVIRYLGEETIRPAYGEPVMNVFRRREPWFAECSNFQFTNITNSRLLAADVETSEDLARSRRATTEETRRFFGHITGQRPTLVSNFAQGHRSYFLTLTYPDVTEALPQIEELTAGVDAIELRVDLLCSKRSHGMQEHIIPPLAYVADQIAALRRETRLPVVFTVRTVSQGGAFPDNAEKEAFDLLRLALRLGVEYLDVEISWSETQICQLNARKGSSKVIASWHDCSEALKWDSPWIERYQLAHRLGDIVKLVGTASVIDDNFSLSKFVAHVSSASDSKPIIAFNMGPAGQLSRMLNTTLTPLTHPLLPTKAAPGQLSFAEIQTGLHLIGQLPACRYFLFGNPISHSPSPTLHNTGFQILGLPHTYQLFQTDSVGEEIKAILASPDFGGASVTIPFKLDVIPLLDELSPAARAIGAVNTIVPHRVNGGGSDRHLYGDNTDWLGILGVVRSNLDASKLEAALVIGSGGTARAALYALHVLGVKLIYVFNRTRSKAQLLVDAFPQINMLLLDKLGAWPSHGCLPNVVVSTIPASATTIAEGDAGSAVHLPKEIFAAPEGIVIDMAYGPSDTTLLSLAKAVGQSRWVTVAGVEVLLEQGFAQFELWTGRRCPRKAVADAVKKRLNGKT